MNEDQRTALCIAACANVPDDVLQEAARRGGFGILVDSMGIVSGVAAHGTDEEWERLRQLIASRVPTQATTH